MPNGKNGNSMYKITSKSAKSTFGSKAVNPRNTSTGQPSAHESFKVPQKSAVPPKNVKDFPAAQSGSANLVFRSKSGISGPAIKNK